MTEMPTWIRSPVTGRAALLVAVCGAWVYAGWFLLERKVGLLDDAFIYLHVASNVLEEGLARFFPVAENPSLLTSSPLRLLVLLPAVVLARLVAEPARSVEVARWAFLLSGPLTCLLFLPFFGRAVGRWGTGCLAAAVLAVCTESALQMEGLLIFWVVFSLFAVTGGEGRSPGRVGFLVGLLVLTRPEYGLPAAVAAGWLVARSDGRSGLAAWFRPLLGLGLGWVLVARLLSVYPIPTTYLTKLFTADWGLFGPPFLTDLVRQVQDYFGAGWEVPPLLLGALLGVVVFLLGWLRPLNLVGLLILGVVLLITTRGASNYLWYYENLFVALLALGFAQLVNAGRSSRRRRARLSWLVGGGLIAAFMLSSWGDSERAQIWGLRDEVTRGTGYRNLAGCHHSGGLFVFPEVPPAYLFMMEIGMVSYFGGPEIWLLDRGGLAQAGTLLPPGGHPLASFYPRSLLKSGIQEMRALNRKFGRDEPPAVWKAWGVPDAAAGRSECDYYFPAQAICLQGVTLD